MSGCQPKINTQRHVYQVETLAGGAQTTADRRRVQKCKKKRTFTDYVRKTVPSVDWLFLNYRWSEDIVEDTVAGITVAVLNIPQGMAYAILGNVDPSCGLYMAVFPVLVYSLLGTSRHISLGALSVVCLMAGKVVLKHSVDTDVDPDGYDAIQVATAVTLLVGIIQLLMYVFRLGMLSNILSESLVSGFTAAVAIIVFTSMLKELLGVSVASRNGMLQLPYTYYDLVVHSDRINWATATVSVITIVVFIVYGTCLKEKINRRLCMPLPIELLVTVASTVFFQVTTIAQDYNMVQIGKIKPGLPSFEVPPVDLFTKILVESFVIALIGYSITMSLALMVSEKLKYPLDSNQELLAQGMSNVVGSFFSCLPCGASPSRSASQQTVGGKTQMASIVSAAIIVVVLLWIGVIFEPLPRCILSSIVVVALKGILWQVFDFPKTWRNSKSDGAIWMATYVTVLLFNIDLGLLVGIVVSLLIVFIKGVSNDVHVLGRLPDTDLYMRLDMYSHVTEVPEVKILRYTGSLNVINRYRFKGKVLGSLSANNAIPSTVTAIDDGKNATEARPLCVVIDMAALQYVDAAGIKVLCELIESLASDKLETYLAAVPDNSFEYILGNVSKSVKFFPTVHDAVVFHQCSKNI